MDCFGRSDRKKRLNYIFSHTILIHAEAPENRDHYMPRVSKHIAQNEPDIIDDPSSVFYDPNEKADFVYSAVPYITANEKQSYILENTDDYYAEVDNKHLSGALESQNVKESPLSSEYDDSLDRTRSQQNTPTTKNIENIFNGQFEVSSRRDSLEFDPIALDQDYHAILNTDEDFSSSIRNPIGLSEEEVKKLYESSHENSLVDDYADLKLYEDELLETGQNILKMKGYLSDAESTKTYQDSGIYDEDIESPKPLSHNRFSQVARQLVFGTEDVEEEGDGYAERLSAFKTPLSSRQNSLDSIASLTSPVTKAPPPIINARKEETSTIEKSQKHSNKYSHVQAKVQCHRDRRRSPSPGSTLRKKSPSSKKPPMVFSKFNKNATVQKNNTKVNPKVDSRSNIKHEPAGGNRKVFQEKLNFREKAKARTDSHGIEMYSHLPEEFQEIARRLARQDHQLKRQESQRGRSLSHSCVSSRQSSLSPTRGRGRTRTPSKRLTPSNSISDIFAAATSSKSHQEHQKPNMSLSRSSSIRSIPSTPQLSRQHPSTALRQGQKSPSPGQSPLRRKEAKVTSSSEKVRDFELLTDSQQKKNASDHPSPVSKLYQFTTDNDSFGSPQYTANPIFQTVPVR